MKDHYQRGSMSLPVTFAFPGHAGRRGNVATVPPPGPRGGIAADGRRWSLDYRAAASVPAAREDPAAADEAPRPRHCRVAAHAAPDNGAVHPPALGGPLMSRTRKTIEAALATIAPDAMCGLYFVCQGPGDAAGDAQGGDAVAGAEQAAYPRVLGGVRHPG